MSKRKKNIESEYAGFSVYKGTRSKPITEFLELPEKNKKQLYYGYLLQKHLMQ